MRRVRLTLAATAALLLAGAPAHAAGPRPDVLVPRAQVSVDGLTVAGSVVVRNDGRRSARRSRAALVLTVAGRPRVLARLRVARLAPGERRRVRVRATVPGGLPAGRHPVRVCADAGRVLRERREGNNCRRVATLVVAAATTPPPQAPTPPATPGAPVSSVPPEPIPFTAGQTLKSGPNWINVAPGYDATHQTPAPLFVWLHGCGGQSRYDIEDVKPTGGRTYVAITVDGREDGCWNMAEDPPRVLAAIADVKRHFNVDPRRVVLGGYSSGGDLSYRVAFTNSAQIAGILVENTSPFRDTGLTREQALAAPVRFRVVHLAHTEDDTYSIAGVREETAAVRNAGFPLELVERAGTHYDADAGDTGTVRDMQTILLPRLADGWTTP